MLAYLAGYSGDKFVSEIEGADCLLGSYLEFKNRDYYSFHKERGLLDKKLFLDSGAFGAFTRGVKIDIDEYANFIKENENLLEVYATLDVIGDYKGTEENTKYLESLGLHPLPTFHVGSPYEVLEKMVEEYDYIALGGLVPISTDKVKMQAHLDKCFSIIKTKCKVHGFGVNGVWAWLRYPFYSVDATSWLMGGKFRRKVRWNPKTLKIEAVSKKDDERSLDRMLVENAHYKNLNHENAGEYLKAAQFVTKLWDKRGVKW